ncbi:MAG: SLC13 family permease [Bacteroidales bacterium]|nr:SLC13 family permease [Bacteroidales bacterium]MCB8998624.1 SLC13 family permease [Bacteroidales bacterium]MCB9012508.1 SLC13 family permease [Bacteroidales bacterium]
MFTFDLILVIIIILFILISLYWGILGPSLTFVIAAAILGFFGILTPHEILGGFANEQIAVIILLLLIGDIIRHKSVIENLFDRILSGAKTHKGFLSRMIIFASALSSVLNNTPLVAVMMPYINTWCKRNKVSPSKFLMTLSYATILGGCATLIGTSTNLIVNGMLVDQIIFPNLKTLGFFDFTPVGLAMMIIGFFYLRFIGDKIMPDRDKPEKEQGALLREFVVESKVIADSHLVGLSLKEAGFLGEKSYILVEIIRDKIPIMNFTPDFKLEANDILMFTGNTETIAEMISGKTGLQLPEVGMMSRRRKTEVVEIVVSQNSSLIGKTVETVNFRSKYDAAVIAIHRNGVVLKEKLRRNSLRAGDVLLLFTGENFLERTDNTLDFYFISKVRGFVKLEWYKTLILLGGLGLTILLSALGILKLFLGLIALIIVLLAMKITNPKELTKSIDYNLAIIIVLSLALGIAMIKTGAASLFANSIVHLFMPLGAIGILSGIYLITTILAAYITSKAAAALVFPIALTSAAALQLNPVPFVLVVAFASAANFMTPIGFQTNLMVYGPGKYNFTDFMKVGAPLTLIYGIVTIIILKFTYF